MLAVLGIALITMGEDIGSEMSLRTFNHLVILLLSLEAYCSLFVSMCVQRQILSNHCFVLQ